MRWTAFVIHLERATQRRAQAQNLLASLPLDAEILPAVDGSLLTEAEKTRVYRRRLHAPRYPFVLSQTEMACFLSHRTVWQLILDRDLAGALIVEDDVAIVDDRFPAMLAAVIDAAEPGDYIRFPRWERGEAGSTRFSSGDAALVEPFLPGLGTQMQLVGREAARRLLAATETFDRPVDSFLQMQWLHGARVLSARPIVIREIDRELGGTVVQKKKTGLREKLEHELVRPFFRSAVRRRNHAWRTSGTRS